MPIKNPFGLQPDGAIGSRPDQVPAGHEGDRRKAPVSRRFEHQRHGEIQ